MQKLSVRADHLQSPKFKFFGHYSLLFSLAFLRLSPLAPPPRIFESVVHGTTSDIDPLGLPPL